jgi:hypothetical protein
MNNYDEYYDDYDDEFNPFEKIAHRMPKDFKNEKHFKSNQDKYKAKRKAKTQEKQRMISNFGRSYE